MENGGPSTTARRVAAHRLGFTRVPAPYGDPAADDALAAAGSQAVVATHSPVVAAVPGAHLLELARGGSAPLAGRT